MKTPPPLSNEIFGLIIETLGEDIPSLRSCSLVSCVFRHFCSPTLYRNIDLDCREKLETCFQLGELSDSLTHTRSLSLTSGFVSPRHLQILDIISQKAPLETLRLYDIRFHAEPFTVSSLSKPYAVTVLSLKRCRFGGFEDFVSFVRCFPGCKALRLDSCTWEGRHFQDLKLGCLPTHSLAPVHLEIIVPLKHWSPKENCDQGRIVGMSWLDLTGLRSFKYMIENEISSERVVGRIATCEHLEEVDMSISYFVDCRFGKRKLCCSISCSYPDQAVGPAGPQLAQLIGRIKLLTLRCTSGLIPWYSFYNVFPPSLALERIRILTIGQPNFVGHCRVFDNTLSDTERYPSLVRVEVYSFDSRKTGREARDTFERLCMDEYLPRLKALGRLHGSSMRSVESAAPVDPFGSLGDAYYKDWM